MTPDPRDALSLLLAAILAMGSVVTFLFLRYQAAQERRLEDIRDDRNFLRDQLNARQETQMQTLTTLGFTLATMKEGIAGLRLLLEQARDTRRER